MDFNRACLSATPINAAINAMIEAAAAPEINNRQYLGASSVGSECLRRVQYDWMVDAVHPQRMRDIFFRGDVFENRSRELLAAAGFRFEPDAAALNFSAVGGLFCGHADGIIIAGPDLPWLGAALHLGAQMSGLARMERNRARRNREGAPAILRAGSALSGYLNATNPALVTVVNADTCERLHLLVPFNAEHAQAWSDRAIAVIEATRRGELLPRFTSDPRALAVPHVRSPRAMLEGGLRIV